MTRRTWLQALAGVPIVGRLVKAEPPIVGVDWGPSKGFHQERGRTQLGVGITDVYVRLLWPVDPKRSLASAWISKEYQIGGPPPALFAQVTDGGRLIHLSLLSYASLPMMVDWTVSEVR